MKKQKHANSHIIKARQNKARQTQSFGAAYAVKRSLETRFLNAYSYFRNAHAPKHAADFYGTVDDLHTDFIQFLNTHLSTVISADNLQMTIRLLVALAAGAVIGYERTYHARPAGFRTHSLVCTASCLLMLITAYEAHWVPSNGDSIRLDPTRMAQGIMTGIGFLGAGVIFKEGLSVRGLTTAASIWMTAAIGILAGIGFYFPLLVSVLLTLGVLSLFRWIESRMPAQAFYYFDVGSNRSEGLSEEDARILIETYGFSIANFSYRLEDHGDALRHSMLLRTTDRTAASRLAEALIALQSVREFQISPTGDWSHRRAEK